MITFPARPVSGGALVRPLFDGWIFEPKYNGWRALINTVTGEMFNRHGGKLSIGSEFAAAITELRALNIEWLDCEALERRHGVGRGSLFVIDAPTAPGDCIARRSSFVGLECLPVDDKPECGRAYRIPASNDAMALYSQLRRLNSEFGCEFYEGIVAKKPTSSYPIQKISPDREFPFWIKHRWN